MSTRNVVDHRHLADGDLGRPLAFAGLIARMQALNRRVTPSNPTGGDVPAAHMPARPSLSSRSATQWTDE
jgi:hypothetical protein